MDKLNQQIDDERGARVVRQLGQAVRQDKDQRAGKQLEALMAKRGDGKRGSVAFMGKFKDEEAKVKREAQAKRTHLAAAAAAEYLQPPMLTKRPSAPLADNRKTNSKPEDESTAPGSKARRGSTAFLSKYHNAATGAQERTSRVTPTPAPHVVVAAAPAGGRSAKRGSTAFMTRYDNVGAQQPQPHAVAVPRPAEPPRAAAHDPLAGAVDHLA
jgi:hypothetical protein